MIEQRERALAFLETAFRNIDLPPLTHVDLDDIGYALTNFARDQFLEMTDRLKRGEVNSLNAANHTIARQAARITQLEAEVERLALRYEEQSKFADPDYAAHFRDFARQLRAACKEAAR